MTITTETAGTRIYVLGDTYPIRDRLRGAGAHWDGQRRAWWIGAAKRAAIEALVASDDVQAAAQPREQAERRDERLTDESRIAGRATYKGRDYVLVWEGETRRGRACKLAFRDGSRVFWADAASVQITKRYEGRERYGRVEPMTFGRLQSLRAKYARAREQGYEDGIADGQRYECEECGERVTRGQGSCWETGCAH
jgi:hypothetical protein